MGDNTGGKLSDKQEMFCKEYVIDLNAARAARASGYSKKTASRTGVENLSKPRIQKRIAQLQKPTIDRLGITKERVLKEIAKLAFSNIKPLLDDKGNIKKISDMTDDEAAAISSLEISSLSLGVEEGDGVLINKKMKLYGKDKSLNMLMKHLNLYAIEPEDPDGDEMDEAFL